MHKNKASFVQRCQRCAASIFGFSLLAFTGTSASATVVTYSDPAAFEAAVPDATNYSMPYPTSTDPVPRPFILGPLGFSTYDHFTRLFLENNYVYGPNVPYLATIQPFGSPVSSVIDTQEPGITALAFDLATRNGADIVSVSINFQPNQPIASFTTPGGAPNTVFFGITDTEPLTQIAFFTSTGSEIDILDFYAGTAAVPEPSTYAMVGAALAGGLLLRRHRTITPA